MIDTGETPASISRAISRGGIRTIDGRFASTCSQNRNSARNSNGSASPPADIRWVVLTHLHVDHVGGLEHVPDCEIIVSAAEFAGPAGGPAAFVATYRIDGPPGLLPGGHLPRPCLRAVPLQMALTRAGDVILVDTSGHTPGHLSVVLEDDETPRLFFAGDAAYTQDLMLQGRVDGVAPDDQQALRTFKRMQQLVSERPTVFLPTHDPDAAERLAQRRAVPSPFAL